MWKGLSIEDIKKSEELGLDVKNELNHKIEKLHLELTQSNQRELEKDREIIFEKSKNAEFKSEMEKSLKEKEVANENYERRISDLKSNLGANGGQDVQ